MMAKGCMFWPVHPWLAWALLPAMFAALNGVFARVSVADVSGDKATLVRTVVIGVVLTVLAAAKMLELDSEVIAWTWMSLVLSGLAIVASWLRYFRALKVGDAIRLTPTDRWSGTHCHAEHCVIGRAPARPRAVRCLSSP